MSVDPLADKFPNLTPYQFANDSPLANVDLDGLESYFAADGRYLGTDKENGQIRIMTNNDYISLAEHSLNNKEDVDRHIFSHVLPLFSKEAHLNSKSNKRLINNNWVLNHSYYYGDYEKAMMLFSKTLTKDNEQFNVILEGETIKGDSRRGLHGGLEVDPESSKIISENIDLVEEGWQREMVIHTHISGTYKDISDSAQGGVFSKRINTGDVAIAMKYNIPVLLVLSNFDQVKKVGIFKPELFKKYLTEHNVNYNDKNPEDYYRKLAVKYAISDYSTAIKEN